jgi:DNA-binding IclR family transcriptional regulator
MDVETGHFPIRTLPMDIGSHRPIGAGVAGVAYLAALSDNEGDDILRRNARRLAKLPGQSAEAILAAIGDCRRSGYALGPDEPHGRIHGLAIALTSRNDRPIGTLCLNGIPERFSPERIPSLVALLRAEAKAMADAIGLMPNEERHRSQWEPARRRKPAP